MACSLQPEYEILPRAVRWLDFLSNFLLFPVLGLDEDGREVALLQPARARPHRVHPRQRRVPHPGGERDLARLHHREREILGLFLR